MLGLISRQILKPAIPKRSERTHVRINERCVFFDAYEKKWIIGWYKLLPTERFQTCRFLPPWFLPTADLVSNLHESMCLWFHTADLLINKQILAHRLQSDPRKNDLLADSIPLESIPTIRTWFRGHQNRVNFRAEWFFFEASKKVNFMFV